MAMSIPRVCTYSCMQCTTKLVKHAAAGGLDARRCISQRIGSQGGYKHRSGLAVQAMYENLCLAAAMRSAIDRCDSNRWAVVIARVVDNRKGGS